MGQMSKIDRDRLTPMQLSHRPRRRLRHGSKSITKNSPAGQSTKFETGQPKPTITRLAGRYIVSMPVGRVRYIKEQS